MRVCSPASSLVSGCPSRGPTPEAARAAITGARVTSHRPRPTEAAATSGVPDRGVPRRAASAGLPDAIRPVAGPGLCRPSNAEIRKSTNFLGVHVKIWRREACEVDVTSSRRTRRRYAPGCVRCLRSTPCARRAPAARLARRRRRPRAGRPVCPLCWRIRTHPRDVRRPRSRCRGACAGTFSRGTRAGTGAARRRHDRPRHCLRADRVGDVRPRDLRHRTRLASSKRGAREFDPLTRSHQSGLVVSVQR